MESAIIISICLLLLLAYVFDLSSSLTKIPSVILLLLLGYLTRLTADFFKIGIPNLYPLLPVFGTIGLILIVLEGSLELEINSSKIPVIRKSMVNALVPIFALTFLMAWAFQYFEDISFKTAVINAIPFCVISSAIAIPSVQNLSADKKEFVIYESSMSDIFGVLLFNYIILHDVVSAYTLGHFGLQLVLIVIISFICVLGLSFLLSRIKHHVTFAPIILLVILIYSVSKLFHLPGLIFILVFGLFLGNLEELKNYNWIEIFHPEKLDKEVKKFKDITIEATFIVRALFFILFGFLMDFNDIINLETLPFAVLTILTILFIRFVILKLTGYSIVPLLFVAPRGLITILLYLAIPVNNGISFANKSLVIQVIILSIFIMMFGLMKKEGVK